MKKVAYNCQIQKKDLWHFLCKGILFISLFWVIYYILGIAIVDTNSSTRLTFHDFYDQSNIDIAFIGASHVQSGIDTKVAEKRLDCKCFNLGTASQTFAGEYYVLKELERKYNVKKVFLNVEFCGLNREQSNQKACWIISDYMKGITRYEMVFDLFEPRERLMMLSGVCRYRNDISPSWCYRNITGKLCPEYWCYSKDNPVYTNYRSYVYKGFCSPDAGFQNDFFVYREDYGEFDSVSMESNNPVALEYLKKSIRLCKDNGIEVTLFSTPVTRFYLSESGDYSAFAAFMVDFSEENDVNYIDFNLLKDDFFLNREFRNLDHLNAEGAEHFTNVFCDLILNPSSHSFIGDISEKEEKEIIGVKYSIDTLEIENSLVYNWKVYSNMTDESCQYMISIRNEDSDIIYESGIFSDPTFSFDEAPKGKRYLSIYDDEGVLLGTGEIQ